MLSETIQVGLIGAMQRSAPSLTELWAVWTGIPNLSRATFDLVTDEQGRTLTRVNVAPGGASEFTEAIYDAMGLEPPKAVKQSLFFSPRDEAHASFWQTLVKRELNEVEGPVEWWWQLLCIRSGGPLRASRELLNQLIPNNTFSRPLLGFVNPTLDRSAQRAKKLLKGSYRQPTHMVVYVPTSSSDKVTGLRLSLSDQEFKSRLVKAILTSSVSA